MTRDDVDLIENELWRLLGDRISAALDRARALTGDHDPTRARFDRAIGAADGLMEARDAVNEYLNALSDLAETPA